MEYCSRNRKYAREKADSVFAQGRFWSKDLQFNEEILKTLFGRRGWAEHVFISDVSVEEQGCWELIQLNLLA